MKKIILASRSPRRKQLLEWAEVPFDVVVVDTDESYPENLSPEKVAIHIARNKALALPKQIHPIVAADTIVVLGDKIINKPQDEDDAKKILRHLAGKKHMVITGVCILFAEKEIVFSETTEVEFHPLTDSQIGFYVEKFRPFDKAGAYAIQEWIGVIGIKSINGDFYNVVGLPVSRLVRELIEVSGEW